MSLRKALEEYLKSDGSIEFDIYAQNPHDWEWLGRIIPTLIVSSAGGWMPFQAEGLLHNHPFYFRSEQGSANLRVGEIDGDAPYLSDSTLYSSYISYDEQEDEKENFPALMVKLVPLLKKSPFLWEFEANEVMHDDTDSRKYTVLDKPAQYPLHGWGFTPEEGYLDAIEPKKIFERVGWDYDFQKQLILERNPKSTPINADTRKYPETVPNWTVNL